MGLDKIIELAKKLRELANRGEGGEKENAASQLERLIDKYKINLDELDVDKKEWRAFKCNKDQKKFLCQIVSNTIPDWNNTLMQAYKGSRKINEIEFECTLSQWIEINEKFSFYWVKLKEEEEILYNAFIQKNKLFRHKANTTKHIGQEPEMSEKEKERLRRMWLMMDGIQHHTHLKQIEQ